MMRRIEAWLGRKLPPGAKAPPIPYAFAARLKPCPFKSTVMRRAGTVVILLCAATAGTHPQQVGQAAMATGRFGTRSLNLGLAWMALGIFMAPWA